MKNSLKISILSLLCAFTSSEPPPISLEEALKSHKIALVGIFFKGLNSHNPKNNWASCEYCVKCGDFLDFKKAEGTTPPEFYPCTENISSILLHKLISPPKQLQEELTGNKVFSEFHGFYKKKVIFLKRSIDLGEKEENLGKYFPVEADVTRTRKIELETVTRNETFKLAKPTWQEKTWVEMSIDPSAEYKVSLTQGQSTIGWKVAETRSLWPIKKELKRHYVFRNMLELEEMKEIGCKCIRDRYETFIGPSVELMEECRRLLDAKREEVRLAVKLSSCLSRDELSKLHERLSKIEL